MNRRDFVRVSAAAAAAPFLGLPRAAAAFVSVNFSSARTVPFALEEATISGLRAAIDSGRETAVSLVQEYLRRIAAIDKAGPSINAVIELNPDALSIARALDAERKAKKARGPLHGIPVMLKDNIDTHDRMMTTAGSLALVGSRPLRDAHVAQRLRSAGAVILGKTNLSEWANFRGERSTSGWSGRGGQTLNPYALDRNPSGSSSGSAAAVAANLCAAAIGTETDGSIVSPAAHCGIVGLKPTLGLVSRSGIIPIAHSQDTAGPMTRTVADAAILLGVLAGVDDRDGATLDSRRKAHADYTSFLDRNGLGGARIGVARRHFRPGGHTGRLIETALDDMRRAGAALIDFEDDLAKFGSSEREVLLYEFKHDLNAYLASLGPGAPVRSLEEIIAFNEANKEKELPFFGQELMLKAQEKGPLTDSAYLEALQNCRRLARAEGIDAVMDKHRLDAIVAPSGGPAGKIDWLYGDRGTGGSSSPAAVAGYPNITVPVAQVFGLPFGLSFFGRAWSEPVLLRIAFAFEQATRARKPPAFLAST